MQYASYRILFQQRRICVFVLPDLKRSLRNLEALDFTDKGEAFVESRFLTLCVPKTSSVFDRLKESPNVSA